MKKVALVAGSPDLLLLMSPKYIVLVSLLFLASMLLLTSCSVAADTHGCRQSRDSYCSGYP